MNNQKLKEYSLDVRLPVTSNDRILVIGKSLLLHNAGTNTATINGNLTLVAGATIQFNFPHPDEIIASYIRVIFSGGGINRLEIVTAVPIGFDYSNYKPQ